MIENNNEHIDPSWPELARVVTAVFAYKTQEGRNAGLYGLVDKVIDGAAPSMRLTLLSEFNQQLAKRDIVATYHSPLEEDFPFPSRSGVLLYIEKGGPVEALWNDKKTALATLLSAILTTENLAEDKKTRKANFFIESVGALARKVGTPLADRSYLALRDYAWSERIPMSPRIRVYGENRVNQLAR